MGGIGVVGDDITGSNDIGIMFAKSGLLVNVYSHNKVEEYYRPSDVAIVDTDSRFDSHETAYKKVYDATKFLMSKGIEQFYNKTCSVFRGNIGPEFDAMLDAAGEDFGVVVLGFPKNGRTTINGIHYVDGVILEETQFRNDPMNPMTKSNLVDILSEQTKRKVTSINYTEIDRGTEYLRTRLQELRTSYNYVIFDVRDQQDLVTIAEVIKDEKIICGASAIAEETAKHVKSGFDSKIDIKAIPDENKGILITAGSLTRQTASQIEYAGKMGAKLLELDTILYFDRAKFDGMVESLIERAVDAINSGENIVIHTSNDPEKVRLTKSTARDIGMPESELSKGISRSLAAISKEVIERTGQRRIIVAGGDTSASFCELMSIGGMTVYREIQPGLPSSVSIGGAPLLIILKSGSFGSDDFFLRAIKHLKQED